jgi:hypothetical protein
MRAWKTLAALLFVLTLALPARATAMSIPVGALVFDTFIPGPDGTNAFFISNLTGGFALPPDFPVASPLVFDSPLLEWIGPAGSPFDFGSVGIGPGNHDPELQIQFPDIDAFVSARFTAVLNQAVFTLADGRVFQATSTSIAADLVNPAGALAPTDFAILSVDANEITEPLVGVPEPSSVVLLGTALAWSYRRRRKLTTPRQRESLR